MTFTRTIAQAIDANTPTVMPIHVTGSYLYVRSATKPFQIRFTGPGIAELVDVEEGDEINVPMEGKTNAFTAIEVINTDTGNDLTVKLSVGRLPLRGNTGNRNPPTATTPLADDGVADGILATDDGVEYKGIRRGRRRQSIVVEYVNGVGTIGIYNDNKLIFVVDSTRPSWVGQGDGNYTVKLRSGANVYYTGYQLFLL